MQNKQWYESIHRWDNVHEILSKCSIACTSWYAGTLLARQNWLNNFKCTKFLSHCLRVTPIKHKICVHCTPSNILKLFHIYIVHVHALNRNLIENSFFYNNMLNNRLDMYINLVSLIQSHPQCPSTHHRLPYCSYHQ